MLYVIIILFECEFLLTRTKCWLFDLCSRSTHM